MQKTVQDHLLHLQHIETRPNNKKSHFKSNLFSKQIATRPNNPKETISHYATH